MESRWRVNFLVACAGVAMMIALTRVSGIVLPDQWYFSFQRLLFDAESMAIGAILIKALIPIIVGGAVGLIARDNTHMNALAVGFTGAFVMAWPAFGNWADFAGRNSDIVAEREYIFKFIYLVYFAAYAYLAATGARLSTIYLNSAPNLRESIKADLLDWKGTIRPAIIGIGGYSASMFMSKAFVTP